MKCACTPCPECHGVGIVWFSIDGKYIRISRCDDMDIMMSCWKCDGSGITDMCDYCQDQLDHENEQEIT